MKTKNHPLFLNLTQDLIFKSYFKLHKNGLKSLLNTFLPLPETSSVKEVTILDSLLPSLSPDEKNSVMDLRVQLNNGELVNVEMQAFPHKGFIGRIVLYWAKNYSSQLKQGESYQKLCPSYSLIFTTFDLFSETNHFYNAFSIRSNTSPYFCFSQDLNLVTVELSKFKTREPTALIDLREEWCYLLKESRRMGEREWKELSQRGHEMEEAMAYLRKFSEEEQFQILAEAREKNRRDRMARDEYVFDQGKEEGLTTGIQKGRMEIIFNMLQKKADISFISEVTGLPVTEIQKLQKRLQNRT